jgi:hypothetical protein
MLEIRRRSDLAVHAARQEQNQENDENQTQDAIWAVSAIAAMGRAREIIGR